MTLTDDTQRAASIEQLMKVIDMALKLPSGLITARDYVWIRDDAQAAQMLMATVPLVHQLADVIEREARRISP